MRPYLRVANVFEDRIDISDVMEMNFTPAEYEVYRLQHGDILLNEGQSMELVGRPAVYRDEVPGACFTNTLVRFQCSRDLDPEYALAVFLTYLKNGRFQKIATITVNIAHLGAGRFSELEFPLPPYEEQRQIVAEVKRQLSIIQALESQIEATEKRSSRLRQSILKSAFEGRLVAQDPRDEPASALLERTSAQPRANRARLEQPKRPSPLRKRGHA
jgi:type I restriction enzyme S subunit